MAQLEQLGVLCRQVQVDVAAHTSQVEPLLGELEVALAGLRPQTEQLSIYSTVSGARLDGRAMDAAYWVRNLRAPVEFAAAVEALAADGHERFVEVSPHPILSGAMQQGLQARGQQSWIVPSLRRNEDERRVLLESLGTLYVLGQEVAWRALYPEVEQCVELPTYPWQRTRYWPEIRPFDPGSMISAARDRPEDLDSWLYEVEWQAKSRSEGPPTADSVQTGSWLIFADRQGVGAALAEHLTAQGDRAVVIFPGETYACANPEHFRVRVGRTEDLRQLLQAALTPDQPICRGIVHLWNLDAPPTDATSAAELEASQTLGCLSVIQLIQELVRAGASTPARLWLITRGAQPAGDGAAPLAVAQTPIWGLGRTIAQEHPALWGGLVDLDPCASAPQAAAQLSDGILSPDEEDQLAFRDRQRYVARLVRKRSTGQLGRPIRWRTDASYLVTEGIGGIDLQVARWMVEQGARRLILLGRTQLPPRAEWRQVERDTALGQRIAAIRDIEAMGASVHIAAVDLADDPQLAAFLDAYDREGWPPIQGVVHAAGVAHPQSLLELDAEAWSAALRPKVMGGWLLHRLLERTALDFFVLFSSGSALLNPRLLGSYVAANAFLDSLAHYRSAGGLPALSINWGPWADVEMSAEAQQAGEGQFAIRGMRNLTARERLEVLEYLLRDRSAQVAALPIDWSESSQFHPAISASPLLSLVAHDRPGEGSKGPASNGCARLTRAQLLAAEPAERQRLLELHLLAQVVNALGISASGLDVHQPLDALGIDSLMAVELKNQIEVDLGVVVPLRELLEGPTVAHFATLLLDQLAGSQTSIPLATAGR
jgi:acyl transferase domain-containing protein/acyl carrier protein